MGQNLENCKTGKNVFFASLRDSPNAIQRYPSLSQTLKKLQNLEKCIFCWFPGFNAIRRYPSLSQTLEKLQNLENAFFAGFREGFNAIQRYPSLSQTLEKLQNLEKFIFCCFAGGRKTWKNCKTWKNAFFAGFRESFNTIQRYIRPYPRP